MTLAAFGRTVTAGVIGDNIGTGLVGLFGLPLVAAFGAVLVLLARRWRRLLD